jgi:hypothetical protein
MTLLPSFVKDRFELYKQYEAKTIYRRFKVATNGSLTHCYADTN